MTIPIPQPKAVPILGNLPDIDIHAPVQSMMRLAQENGPIFRLAIGARTVIILSSQALVNEVCDETRFAKRLHAALVNVRDIGGDGLFTAYNEEPNWAKAHRLLAPAFGPIGIRRMFPRMLDIAEQMLARWERFGPDAVIDVPDHMTRLTLDTIALCAFDVRFNSFYRDDPHPFVAAMGGALDEAGARSRRPALVSRLNVRASRRYEADIRLLHEVADKLIAERRRDPEAGQRDDLLHVLLNGRDPVTGEGLSDENVRYQIVTFLIAGHETTSGLLAFAIHLLLDNPAVLERTRAEIDVVLGDDAPRVEDLARLPLVAQVLQETLRLWPTASAFAVSPRAPTEIGGGYAVAPDDVLMVLAPMLHRDPAAWGADAEAFRPERFAPGAAVALAPNCWKPFGNGERSCIGRGFALQEAQLVLALLLQRFEIARADPDYRLEIVETLTIKPGNLRIRARRRGPPGRPVQRAMPEPAPAAATAAPAVPEGERTPLLVLYGSNTGSCEAFAMRVAADAAAHGYDAVAQPMDARAGDLRGDGATILVTASYEGRPPDNARAFMEWLEGLAQGSLAGLRYAVFGCGNRQWARTYQAIPQRTDALLEAAGATRLRARGEADASGDFFGGFEAWYAGLWHDLGTALGKAPVTETGGPGLVVEVQPKSRATTLRLSDLELGTVIANRELVDLTSPHGRSKRHVEIALPEGMPYRAGDYLAVLPRNPRPTIERVLRRFGLPADAEVVIRGGQGVAPLPLDRPVGLWRILSDYVELDQPATRLQVDALAQAARCPPEREALADLARPETYAREILGKRTSLLDLLERFPACDMGLGAFLAALPPMRARQYSISSSPRVDPGRCSLTVAVLDAPALSGQGRRLGVASNFLAGLSPGERIAVAVRASQAEFHAPAAPETPLILVCAGTGFAPFRGFLQERSAQKRAGAAVGPTLLFFGVMHPEVDYLYRDELAAWQAEGIVDLRPAFSRAPDGEVRYVQHRLWRDRAAVVDLFAKGAVTFVCGDGERMAPAVRETFIRIYRDATGADEAGAQAWAETVEREKGRYVTDVFA
jgi:cytochrome P450/NADPH-cytochrome P450 reductase